MNLSIGLSGLVLMAAGFSDNVGPAFGLGLEGRAVPPAWDGVGLSLGLEFRALPPGRVTLHEPIDSTKPTVPVGVDVSTWAGVLVPCVRFARYFSGCVVGQLGALVEKGPVEVTSGWTGAFGPRLGVEIPFAKRFAIVGIGELLFNPYRHSLTFKGPAPNDPQGPPANVIWYEPAVSGLLGAGLAVTFE